LRAAYAAHDFLERHLEHSARFLLTAAALYRLRYRQAFCKLLELRFERCCEAGPVLWASGS